MLQPIVKNPLDRCSTPSALFDQLSDRVSFGDPSFEPDELSSIPHSPGRPTEASKTRTTQPPLFAVACATIALDPTRSTMRTSPFFVTMLNPFLTSISKSFVGNKLLQKQQHKVSTMPILNGVPFVFQAGRSEGSDHPTKQILRSSESESDGDSLRMT